MTAEVQAADVTSAPRAKVSAEALQRHVRSQHFAVLATTGADGSADSAGVSYRAVVESGELVLYIMTRRHLRKARDIARQPRVSLVIPIRRRLLWFIPPATVQLRGQAELLPQDDQRGTLAFQGFFLGRRILAAYRAMRLRGDDRICFVRITLDSTARSYMVGASLWQVIRRMEAGAATTDLRASQDAPRVRRARRRRGLIAASRPNDATFRVELPWRSLRTPASMQGRPAGLHGGDLPDRAHQGGKR